MPLLRTESVSCISVLTFDKYSQNSWYLKFYFHSWNYFKHLKYVVVGTQLRTSVKYETKCTVCFCYNNMWLKFVTTTTHLNIFCVLPKVLLSFYLQISDVYKNLTVFTCCVFLAWIIFDVHFAIQNEMVWNVLFSCNVTWVWIVLTAVNFKSVVLLWVNAC
jgi:hypothetical protein